MHSPLDAPTTADSSDRNALDELLFGCEKAFDPAELAVFLPPVPIVEMSLPPSAPPMLPVHRLAPPVMESLPPREENPTPFVFPEVAEEKAGLLSHAGVSDGTGYYQLANLGHGVYEVCSPNHQPDETVPEEYTVPPPAHEEPEPPPQPLLVEVVAEAVEESDPLPAQPLAVEEAVEEVPPPPPPAPPPPAPSPPAPPKLVVEVNAVLRLAPGERVPLGPEVLAISGTAPGLIDLMLLSPPVEGVLLRDGFALTGGDNFTQEEIASGRVNYRHDGEPRDSEDRFTIATADGAIPPTVVAVSIEQRRRAPRLLGSGALEAINEGIAVEKLLANHVEADGECGMAVVGVAGTGTWAYSLDEGATWQSLAEVAPVQARLLGPTDHLRFTPAGPATIARITYRAWDQSAESAGAIADLSSRQAIGGQTAFSQECACASIRLAALVAPRQRPASPPWGDALSGEALLGSGLAIVRLAGEGVWQFAPEGADWCDCGTVYHGRALLLQATDQLRFLPNKAAQGKVTLTVRSWDGLEGSTGDRVNLAGRASVGGNTPFGASVQSWTWRLDG